LVELISYLPPERQESVRQLFKGKYFEIAPFDELAAAKCTELMDFSFNETDLVKYRTEQVVFKNKIRLYVGFNWNCSEIIKNLVTRP